MRRLFQTLYFTIFLFLADDVDQEWPLEEPGYVIWALGTLDSHRNYHHGRWPTFHYIYPKADVAIDFKRKPQKNCHSFTQINTKYR